MAQQQLSGNYAWLLSTLKVTMSDLHGAQTDCRGYKGFVRAWS